MPVVPATDDTIAQAAGEIAAGGLVAFPTETVYGLGADARNARAVAAIYATKGRPSFNPLIVHVATRAEVEQIAVLSPVAVALAERFWPGPLTLVLPAQGDNGIADLVTAGLDTVAVRVPAAPVALALIRASGCAIAAPSANRSGHVSPTTAAHVAADFEGRSLTILDGGPCVHGLESTIVDVSGDRPVLLRAGAVQRADIEVLTGMLVSPDHGSGSTRPTAPGQLDSHYAPRLAVRLDVTAPAPTDALLAFGPAPSHPGPVYNLSPSRDLTEAATRLFAGLRELDHSNAKRICAMPIPFEGLGEAINDRLSRAAAPREPL